MLLILFIQLIGRIEAYQYDDVLVIDRMPFGQISMNWFVQQYNMYYRINAATNHYCEPLLYDNFKCDLILYMRVCILKSEFFHQVFPNTYDKKDKPTFSLNWENGATTTINTLDGHFNCSAVKVYKFGRNKNSEVFYGNGLDVYDYIGLLGDIYQIYSSLVEDQYYYNSWGGGFWFYPYYYSSVSRYTAVGKDITVNDINYVQVTKSYALLEFLIKAKCLPNYYGYKCWFWCVDNTRRFCNCQGYRPQDATCKITCKPGWTGRHVVYSLEYVNLNISNILCDIYDSCYNSPCDLEEHCFIATNSTNFCEKINIDFIQEGINITGTTFAANYIVLVNISQLKNIDIRQYFSFSFTNGSMFMYYPFKTEEFDSGYEFSFPNKSFIDIYMMIEMVISANPWKKLFYRQKTFKVLSLITYVYLTNEYENETETNVFYLGQFAFCQHDGLPIYRIILYYESTLPIKNKLSLSQEIYLNSTLGKNFITCNFILISYEMGFRNYTQVNNIIIKPFVYFKWNEPGDIFLEGDVLECLSFQYIPIILTIFQLEGDSLVPNNGQQLNLTNIKGDIYTFVCLWTASDSLAFSRRKHFMFAKEPSFACSLFYVPTYGGLVQCGHNGYPPDEYVTKVTIFIGETYNYIELGSQIDNLRISYLLNNPYFYVVCTVKKLFHDSFKEVRFQRKQKLSKNYLYKYGLNNNTKICYEYRDNIEELSIVAISHNEKVVKVQIFVLKEKFMFVGIMMLYPVIILFLVIVNIVGYAVALRTTQGAGITVLIDRKCRSNKRRALCDRMVIEANCTEKLFNADLQNKFKARMMSSLMDSTG